MHKTSPENQAVLLKYSVLERENELEKLFMEEGPKALCEYLGIDSLKDPDFEAIFDYFVIERNFLAGLVKRYLRHFRELYEEHGPTEVRNILWIGKAKYDAVWKPLHDLVGIAEGALLNFTYHNRFTLNRRLQVFGGDNLREYLEIEGEKYSETWLGILDILLKTTTSGYFNERIFDDSMRVFTMHLNSRRQHGSVAAKARV